MTQGIEKKNAFYAQSGGVTAVINASACGVIETARQYSDYIDHMYAGVNGVLGALHENIIDTNTASTQTIAALKTSPAGAFGSCRYKLKDIHTHQAEYERLISVFKAHNIAYFFYNGGGDSQDTCLKVSSLSQSMGYPITCIGVPKTIDNDLAITDNSPGFGSVAKYVAISTLEAAMDVKSMCETSTKVFVLEVMGRHAGWIAAAAGLAGKNADEAPHIILFPEIAFEPSRFLTRVKEVVERVGYCVIVVSEGCKNESGEFLADAGIKDAFGHTQLGGVAPTIAQMIKQELGYKYHYAISDYLQRSARHIASKTDVEQAYAVGKAAVEFAIQGKNAIMPTIIRHSDSPYSWSIGEASLSDVANQERAMPRNYISENGFQISDEGRRYLLPLIEGEAYPEYSAGLPIYLQHAWTYAPKKLAEFSRR